VGRIGEITRIERTDIDGDKVVLLTVDFGGNDVVTAPYMPQPGDDGLPLVGDTALVVELENDPGEYMGLAALDVAFAGQAGEGERYIRARDADGATVASVYLKSDGAILAGNENCSIELGADGAIKFENDSGYVELKSSGQVDINGRFTVDP